MSDLRGRLHTVLKTVAAELIVGKASSAQQWEQVAQHQQIILNKFADTMLDAIMPTVEEGTKEARHDGWQHGFWEGKSTVLAHVEDYVDLAERLGSEISIPDLIDVLNGVK